MEVADTNTFMIPSQARQSKYSQGGVVVHNCQSLSQHETKTIISRCGENTKIIFTGDIDQIDNPYVNKESNGLTAAVKNIRDNPIVGHIFLNKGERSALADLAVKNL
jgi:PhoH-like ATPase